MKKILPATIALLDFGNSLPVVRDSADLQPGVIALANESRFTTASYSEPLTQYTVGWRDPNNYDDMINWIAPQRPVPKRFEFKRAKNAEQFIGEVDDSRAIGASFKAIGFTGETITAKTQNRGLTMILDQDDMVYTDEQAVSILMQRLKLGKLRRAFTVLLAIDAGTAKVWDNTANPDGDIDDLVGAAQLDGGLFPNRAVIGLPAWTKRKRAYAPQQNAGASAGYGLSATQVAQAAGLDDMKISRELFQATAVGKNRILASQMVVYSAFDSLDKDDSSNMKGFYTPCEGGTQYRVYIQELDAKRRAVTVEHHDLIMATTTVGVKRYNIT